MNNINIMDNEDECELCRTDSTLVSWIPKKNGKGYVGTKLSPLGRERKINRLNKFFILELKNIKL